MRSVVDAWPDGAPRQIVIHYMLGEDIRGRAVVLDEREEALAEAMRQAERYGENRADFAGQPRVSFRVEPEQVREYR
jgi:hypothetical protein